MDEQFNDLLENANELLESKKEFILCFMDKEGNTAFKSHGFSDLEILGFLELMKTRTRLIPKAIVERLSR